MISIGLHRSIVLGQLCIEQEVIEDRFAVDILLFLSEGLRRSMVTTP